MTKGEGWDLEIKPKVSLFDINLKEIWKYRDLLFLFVKRDIVTVYQQTILGPLWFFLQPILTSLTYVVVFGKIAKIETGAVPNMLYYLSGITIWNYFTTCLSGSSSTFTANANIFGKVYFPRLVTPISFVVSNIIKFFIQLLPLILFYLYYVVVQGVGVRPNISMLLLPLLLVIAGVMGMSIGLIVSSLTTKYRDLSFVVTIGLQLAMYVSTVIYPQEKVHNALMLRLIKANPMTWVIDAFHQACFSVGNLDWMGLLYASGFTLIVFLIGLVVFNKVEKTFIDTV